MLIEADEAREESRLNERIRWLRPMLFEATIESYSCGMIEIVGSHVDVGRVRCVPQPHDQGSFRQVLENGGSSVIFFELRRRSYALTCRAWGVKDMCGTTSHFASRY